MILNEEFVAMRTRIAKAEAERDAWHRSGMQEKYLEACSTVQALELQLEGLRQEGLRSTARGSVAAAAPAVRTQAAIAEAAGDRHRLMAAFAIRFDGRHYHYDRYRYDRLDDAVDYAHLRGALAPGHSPDDADAASPASRVDAPDETGRELMAALGITYQDGVYHLDEYRYDRLADAVNYARLRRLHARADPPPASQT